MFALSNQLARGAYESISKDELFETLKHRMGKETGFNLMRRDFDAVIEWAEESCLLMVDSEGLLWPTIG